MFRFWSIGLFIFCFSFSAQSQDVFRLPENNPKEVLEFTLANNLVVIPVEINGKVLSFLLDTGIDKTILFNLKFSDSLELHNIEQIKLQGLGEGEALNALRSTKNILKIGEIVNRDHLVYVVLDDTYDLSAKLGMDIHGIIGGELFEDFVIEINYPTKKITFSNPLVYQYKNCNKCETLPLEFRNNKPYIDLTVIDNNNVENEVTLLIDSGGGDALWLFENQEKNIRIPSNYFNDYLGKGLTGNIYGKRSRIKELILGKMTIENPTVAYPDSSSVVNALTDENRNGTLGAEILRRFKVIYDYPNQKITFKKTKSYFKDPFIYNKSGIELVHGGDVLVKETNARVAGLEGNKTESSFAQFVYSFGLAYKPSYEIAFLRPDSPALKAGLQVGDVIVEINGKSAFEKEMQDIIATLSRKDGEKVNLVVDRNGKQLRYRFVLEDLLKK